jgi:transposase-like protein
MNLIDVTQTFKNDDDCLAYLETMRWPDGIKCPTCGSGHISKITRKTESKNKRTRIYQCLDKCTMNSKGKMINAQFSATNGTIFNDSHLPLTKWFMALAIVVDAKKGMSAKQLQEHLGIGSYKTAWYMAHRIRKSMVDADPMPMSGTVEIDETYIGGTAKRRFNRAKEPKAPKEIVMAMRERSTPTKPGRVRYFHVPNAKQATINPLIDKHVSGDVEAIYTDAATVYDFTINEDHRTKHAAVNHSIQWIVPGTRVHTNTVENSFSLLKRGLIGSFHRVSIKHLHRYLTEFEYRFNARKAADRFNMTLENMLGVAPMTYAALTANPEPEEVF